MKDRPQKHFQSRAAAPWQHSKPVLHRAKEAIGRRPEQEVQAGWVPLVRQGLRDCAGGPNLVGGDTGLCHAGRSGLVHAVGSCRPQLLLIILPASLPPALPQNGSGSCLVDMSTVWWEAADFAELCVVTAEEMSISLWRPLERGQWGTVHTWNFAKVSEAAVGMAPPWACLLAGVPSPPPSCSLFDLKPGERFGTARLPPYEQNCGCCLPGVRLMSPGLGSVNGFFLLWVEAISFRIDVLTIQYAQYKISYTIMLHSFVFL